MIAATRPLQRPPDAKLLIIDEADRIVHSRRAAFADFLQPGDLVVANDAATLPGSLLGVHERTSSPVEVRLAGRNSLSTSDVQLFSAVVFGAGDYHTRTEHRPRPPALRAGDRLTLGPLTATIVNLLGHPRLVTIDFDGDAGAIWAGLAEHGRPISTRMSTPRSPCGMSGPRSPAHLPRSSRRRPGSRPTGTCCRSCAAAASRLRPSPTPPASRRPATTPSTLFSPSTSRT